MTSEGADLAVVSPTEAAPVRPSENPALVYIASLGTGSIASQQSALRILARLITGNDLARIEDIPWHLLRPAHTLALAARLGRLGFAPTYRMRLQVALRGVMFASWRIGYINSDERDRATDFPKIRGERLAARTMIQPDDVRKLVDGCDVGTFWGQRLLASVALLFGAGLRRAEAVALRTETVSLARGTARVIGKGDKERVVIFGEWSDALRPWLASRGDTPGPLLCFIGKWGTIDAGHGITPARLYAMMSELSDRVGVEFTPHDARATVITSLLAAGIDLRRVQQFAGHANPRTTAGYDLAEDEAVIAAITSAGRVTLGKSG